MSNEISVIICTHNPRMDYLPRVLEALREQTLPQEQWELLLIDNKSEEILEGRVDLSWHPHARVVREEQIGLTQARLRGIAEAKGGLLVFVDDDNVLENCYLENALSIASVWEKLGAWSGSVIPEYEVLPPEELKPYLWTLCIREVKEDLWGNSENFDSTPLGAGMCIRKEVAERYASHVLTDPVKAMLDRRGESLASSGDIDMARTSLIMGLGTGVFAALRLTHIIPQNRLTQKYFIKMIEDSTAANYVFCLAKNQVSRPQSTIDRLVEIYKYLRASKFEKMIVQSRRRGIERGRRFIAENNIQV
jgi:glycosyltransferase involved in cell wall biosynthesis